jgi:hypothetical protein
MPFLPQIRRDRIDTEFYRSEHDSPCVPDRFDMEQAQTQQRKRLYLVLPFIFALSLIG